MLYRQHLRLDKGNRKGGDQFSESRSNSSIRVDKSWPSGQRLPRLPRLVLPSWLPSWSYYNFEQLAQLYNILMNRVEELIIQALTTANDNKFRQQAETTIFTLLSNNPNDFFLTCAGIVADPNKQETIRQSAASVLKAVLAKRTDKQEYFWDLASPSVRAEVKGILLQNLIESSLTVMRAAANAIAQIAAIEISRGEWLEIINSLAANSMHAQLAVRRASITTLGFICEELRLAKSNIKRETCEQILGSLLLGLQESGELVEISLTALRESICFLRDILENKSYCDKVFEYLFPFLNTDYRGKIYEILFEFGRYCYHLLGDYLSPIGEITLQHIQQRNDNAILALEFWDTVGTEYIKRVSDSKDRIHSEKYNVRNFVKELHHLLLPEVMASILILDASDLDLPEIREGAVKTLGTFVNCCGRELVDKVTEGVSRVIASPNAGERQASALLFSCLCEYPDRYYVEECFSNGFVHLYKLIDDSEVIVRKNTLNGFVTLAESFPEVFLRNKDITAIFDHLINLSTNSDEDVQILSLSILTSITDVLKEFPCSISSQPDSILQKLVSIFTNNLSLNVYKQSNEKIIVVIMNIVIATEKRAVLVMLINHLIGVYYKSVSANIKDKPIVLAQIFTIIHTCVLSMSKFVMEPQLKSKLYELIDAHLQANGVETEGIHMISAVAICFKREFLQEQLDKYWSYIVKGLGMIEQKAVFKAALACISDISRNHEHKITNKLTPVFQRLIEHMHNPIDRELKTEILKCFGDLCLGLKNFGEMFVATLISISDECFEAVYRLSEIESEREYAEELKEALMEMYHCVVFAQNEQDRINYRLANHFPVISTFIVKTCSVALKPTVDYLKLCLYFIFDSALFYTKHKDYKNMVNGIVNSPEIKGLIAIIQNYRDRPDVLDLLSYIEEKLKNQRR